MFPFLNNNGYPVPPFSYNGNYDGYRQPEVDGNPYIYPYINTNFALQPESMIPNQFTQNQIPYFFQTMNLYNQNPIQEQKQMKRITKKLTLTEVRKKIRASHTKFKAIKNTFKHFDPSRAPPVTSLRNKQ